LKAGVWLRRRGLGIWSKSQRPLAGPVRMAEARSQRAAPGRIWVFSGPTHYRWMPRFC